MPLNRYKLVDPSGLSTAGLFNRCQLNCFAALNGHLQKLGLGLRMAGKRRAGVRKLLLCPGLAR
jgi:hypothetical protein